MNDAERVKILKEALKDIEGWLDFHAKRVEVDCEESDKLKDVRGALRKVA